MTPQQKLEQERRLLQAQQTRLLGECNGTLEMLRIIDTEVQKVIAEASKTSSRSQALLSGSSKSIVGLQTITGEKKVDPRETRKRECMALQLEIADCMASLEGFKATQPIQKDDFTRVEETLKKAEELIAKAEPIMKAEAVRNANKGGSDHNKRL